MKTATVHRNRDGLYYATVTETNHRGQLVSRFSTRAYATEGRATGAAKREGASMLIAPTPARAVVDPVADFHRGGSK